MMNPEEKQEILRKLPAVDRILSLAGKQPLFESIPRSVLTRSIRTALAHVREAVLSGNGDAVDFSEEFVLKAALSIAEAETALNLKRLVNATGVVVHTNLGRSLLPACAVENVANVARRYSNLEYDLSSGKRGIRYSNVESLICELTGGEAAMVVNNNAGAVLLTLGTLAEGREVVVSRGELVEIGGSFRIPDVMRKSGAVLREVGATNRTHARDYEGAITDETALLLKVHRSNFGIVGFTKEVPLPELAEMGRARGVPVMEDLGSGTLVDFARYGMVHEPTVQESVKAGAQVITFSGDKLLGGPQAGIIVGTADIIARIRKNPLTRALRIDKMTLAALESVLHLYRDEEKAVREIPTLAMLFATQEDLRARASELADELLAVDPARMKVDVTDLVGRAGGGGLPLLSLPSAGVAVRVEGRTANAVERAMRAGNPPVIGRIEDDAFILDVRTVQKDEMEIIRDAFSGLLNGDGA